MEDPKMYAWLLMSSTDVGEELRSERIRAHEKHRDHSMESWPVLSPERYLVLAEEVGEVAKEFNDAKVEGRPIDEAALRKELVQVAAMAAAWVAALGGGSPVHQPTGLVPAEPPTHPRVDHVYKPGKFSQSCQVMLARYPCPYGPEDHAQPSDPAREWCVSCPDCHPGKVIADPCGKVHDCPECAAQRSTEPGDGVSLPRK